MAATVSSSSPSPWGKPGAWALDAEEHEAELQQQQQQQQQEPKEDSAFPSLAAAAATKQSKKKKKQTLSPSESNNSKSFVSTRFHNEVLNLPTGPRRRSPDEDLDWNRLGGGFRSYGMVNPRGPRGDDSMSNSRGSRFSDRDGGRDRERDYAPSRADEVEDWSKGKKSSFGNGFERRERNGGGSFLEGQVSKADQSDNWAAGKVAVEPRRFGAANGGFDRRGSFDSLSRERHPSGNGGGADADSWGRKKEESDGTGGAVRPRLLLQPRTLPVSNGNGDETVAKPKGTSPFGEARPREEVLAEKGKDWKEIGEKLESLKVSNGKETERRERRDSYGWRRDCGSFRSELTADERSWRKPDAVTDSRPQSAESTENGLALRNRNTSEDSFSETN